MARSSTSTAAATPRNSAIAGWKVPDIGAAVTDLTDRGVQFARYDGMTQDDLGILTAPGGDQVAWFHDPDGYAAGFPGR